MFLSELSAKFVERSYGFLPLSPATYTRGPVKLMILKDEKCKENLDLGEVKEMEVLEGERCAPLFTFGLGVTLIFDFTET